MKVPQCLICESQKINSKEIAHQILSSCMLNVCEECGHQSFIPNLKKMKDSEFSSEYVNVSQHNEGLQKQFLNRKYFIDYSRLILLQHFIFIDDGMNVLELGPGFPGLFQQLKLTGKQLNFHSIESDPESSSLLEEYGVKSIGSYFPLSETIENLDNDESYKKNNYQKYFDIIICCNTLYYFEDPINSLKHMLSMLVEGGVILIDILNEKLINESYYIDNTMREIFTKKSLEIAVKKSGGDLLFINTNCVENPAKEFEKTKKNIASKIGSEFLRKITNRLGFSLVPQIDVMKYFLQVSQLKYGHPTGQYVRAVVTKKNINKEFPHTNTND